MDDVLDRQGQVLDAGAPLLLTEHVDLRAPEEGPPRLVVRELDPRARVPHHDRAQAGSVALVRRDVCGVKLDLPVALEAQDVLHPQDGRGEGGEVRRRVVVACEADAVPASLRLVVRLEAGKQRLVSVALDEAEGRIAEGRRDREECDRAPAVVLERLDIPDGGATPLLEEAERLLDVLDLEVEGPHAVGVLSEPTRGATPFPARLDADHDRVAGHERERLLPAGLRQLLVAAADLLEVQELGVEAAAPLEVVHVVVDGLEPLDSEALHLGHRLPPSRSPQSCRGAPSCGRATKHPPLPVDSSGHGRKPGPSE